MIRQLGSPYRLHQGNTMPRVTTASIILLLAATCGCDRSGTEQSKAKTVQSKAKQLPPSARVWEDEEMSAMVGALLDLKSHGFSKVIRWRHGQPSFSLTVWDETAGELKTSDYAIPLPPNVIIDEEGPFGSLYCRRAKN